MIRKNADGKCFYSREIIKLGVETLSREILKWHMCISKFFFLLGLNSFGKKCLGCRSNGILGKREFTNPWSINKSPNYVLWNRITCIYCKADIRDSIFSLFPKAAKLDVMWKGIWCALCKIWHSLNVFLFLPCYVLLTRSRMYYCWTLFLKLMLSIKRIYEKNKVNILTLKLSLLLDRLSVLKHKLKWYFALIFFLYSWWIYLCQFGSRLTHHRKYMVLV